MRVYILTHVSPNYEGEEITGVFSTIENAFSIAREESRVKTWIHLYDDCFRADVDEHESYYVYPINMDDPAWLNNLRDWDDRDD